MELDASAPANELQKRYKEATSSRRLKGARQLVLVDDVDASIVNDPQRARALRDLVKNARCPVVATCTVSRDADGARCGVLATKLGLPALLPAALLLRRKSRVFVGRARAGRRVA